MPLTLVPWDKIHALLDLQGSGFNDYPALEWIANGIRAEFESHLGRRLEEDTRTETVRLPAEATAQVPLSAIPVTGLTSVQVDGEDQDLDQVGIAPYGIRLQGRRAAVPVTVEYTGGWTDDTVPPELVRAAVYQAAHEFQRKDHVGAEAVETEGGTVQRPEFGLLDHVRRQIEPHRHPMRTAYV